LIFEEKKRLLEEAKADLMMGSKHRKSSILKWVLGMFLFLSCFWLIGWFLIRLFFDRSLWFWVLKKKVCVFMFLRWNCFVVFVLDVRFLIWCYVPYWFEYLYRKLGKHFEAAKNRSECIVRSPIIRTLATYLTLSHSHSPPHRRLQIYLRSHQTTGINLNLCFLRILRF
jgi:hypothetical protein